MWKCFTNSYKWEIWCVPHKNMLLFIMKILPARLGFRSTLLFFFFYTVNFKMIIWCCGFCCRRHHRQFYFYHRTPITSKIKRPFSSYFCFALCIMISQEYMIHQIAVLRIRDVYPGSRMFIPDPGSWFLPVPDPGSLISDPKTATKERGEKKFVVIPFYVATNFTKLNIILVLKCWRKKLFTQKIVTKLSKIWVRDPGSGIRKKTYSGSQIPDPGVKKAPDPGSGSATWLNVFCLMGEGKLVKLIII